MNIISLIALSLLTAIVLYIVLTIIVNYINAARDAIKQRKREEKEWQKMKNCCRVRSAGNQLLSAKLAQKRNCLTNLTRYTRSGIKFSALYAILIKAVAVHRQVRMIHPKMLLKHGTGGQKMSEHIIQYNISIVKRVIGGAEVEPFVAEHIIPHDIKRFEDYCNADMMVQNVQIDAQRFFLDGESNEIDESEQECETCRIDLDELMAEQQEKNLPMR